MVFNDPTTAVPPPSAALLFADFPASPASWERQPEPTTDAFVRLTALVDDTVRAHGGEAEPAPPHTWAASFPSAAQAVAAAFQAQRGALGLWPTPPLRIAIVAGIATADGRLLRRARWIAEAGHAGQVLVDAVAAAYAVGALPAGVELRDLGERAIPDFEHREAVFLAVARDLPRRFPPLQSADRRAHNLILPMTSLVGRQDDLDAIGALLRGGGRLVTLLGPGGIGKTRLATEVAWDLLDEHADGAWCVGLADLDDPALVAAEVADTLKVPVPPGLSPEAAVIGHLHGKDLLLVLDNLEQLLPGAAAFADRLLSVCPKLTVLATSRIPLGLARESRVEVKPLGVPDAASDAPAALEDVPTVRLFLDRARLVRPSFALTAANAPGLVALLRRLDGLPLAVELAAPWVRVATPAQMLDRLEKGLGLPARDIAGLPPRHHAIRSTIAWSHDLLAEEERVVFRRLAAFRGGFTAEAAAHVAIAAGGDADAARDAVCALTECSLVRAAPGDPDRRLTMLEPIREFAAERLAESREENAVRQAHAAYFLARAEVARAADADRGVRATGHPIDDDDDNLREAFAQFERAADAEGALRLAIAAAPVWERRGNPAEARDWLGCALARADGLPAALRAEALRSTAAIAAEQCEVGAARAAAWDALALARDAGHERGGVDALLLLADLANRAGDHDGAEAHLAEATAICQAAGDRLGAARASLLVGQTALLRGDLDRAAAVLGSCRAAGGALASDELEWRAALDLGEVRELRGEPDRAQALYEDAAEAFQLVGDPRGEALALVRLGRVAAEGEDWEHARALVARGLALAEAAGDRRTLGLGLAVAARATLGAGACRQAARLLGAAEALDAARGACVPAAHRAGADEVREALRERLGEAALAAALADGRGLPIHRAVAEARGTDGG